MQIREGLDFIMEMAQLYLLTDKDSIFGLGDLGLAPISS